jgi:hypothetical protein
MAMLIDVHHKRDAGKTAAKACSDQWNRKIRSIKESNVQERLEITIGKASQRISRPPEGPDHQPLAEEPWSFIGSPLLWAESRFMARGFRLKTGDESEDKSRRQRQSLASSPPPTL